MHSSFYAWTTHILCVLQFDAFEGTNPELWSGNRSRWNEVRLKMFFAHKRTYTQATNVSNTLTMTYFLFTLSRKKKKFIATSTFMFFELIDTSEMNFLLN